jgi:hypothetical protein
MITKRGTRFNSGNENGVGSGLVNEGRRAGVAQVLPGSGV